jgi:hypothetical protein
MDVCPIKGIDAAFCNGHVFVRPRVWNMKLALLTLSQFEEIILCFEVPLRLGHR